MSDLERYDPNGVGVIGTLFGLPFSYEESRIVIVPVPWDVTVSYGEGTSGGPAAILNASSQLDLHQEDIAEAWKVGIFMEEIPKKMAKKNRKLRKRARRYIEKLELNHRLDFEDRRTLKTINREGEDLRYWLKKKCETILADGKIPVVLGGEHSVPQGNIEAVSERGSELSVLQIDAHADLRDAYEGFTFSHASIMNHVCNLPGVKKLVQVGIRDVSDNEMKFVADSAGKIQTYSDAYLKSGLYKGKNWDDLCNEIVSHLGDKVYISFDIDGLEPQNCPNTGTPVPGGLSFEQAMYLLKKIVMANKNIVGADLCEVATKEDNDWDANVGARVLYRMCTLIGCSNGWLKLSFTS